MAEDEVKVKVLLECDIMTNHLNNRTDLESFREVCRQFEDKVRTCPNKLEDYEAYLTFLNDCIYESKEMCDKDRRRLGDWRNLESHIRRKLNSVYDDLLRDHGYNFDTCVEYYNRFYYSDKRMPNCINILVENHSSREQTWLLASKWYEEQRHDHDKGLVYVTMGLKNCLSGKLIYKAGMKYELEYIRKSRFSRSEKLKQASKLQAKYLDPIFKNDIKDFNYYMELLELLNKYNFTGPTIDYLNEKLQQVYPHEPKAVWCLAQRVIEKAKDKDYKLMEDLCRIYVDGFSLMLSKEKQIELTDLLLDQIMKCKDAKTLATPYVDAYMQIAHSKHVLLERHYSNWLQFCEIQDMLSWGVLTKGIERYPKSVKLWMMYLHYSIRHDDDENFQSTKEIEKIFKEGVENLKEKALPLWNGYLRFLIIKEAGSIDCPSVISLFKEAVLQPVEISQSFKIKYLEWAILNSTTVEVRNLYEEFSVQEPYIKKLHTCMVHYEAGLCKKREEPGFREKCLYQLERVHMRACQQFEKDSDVWLSYMSFSKTHKPEKLLMIYEQAVDILEGKELCRFRCKWQLDDAGFCKEMLAKLEPMDCDGDDDDDDDDDYCAYD